MSDKDKSVFDAYLDDVGRDLEMRAIINMSQSKSGKIDVAKATGIAMGLGHTSTDDLATFGAHLGASAAFGNTGAKHSTSTTFSTRQLPFFPMPEWEYNRQKKDILDNKRFTVKIVLWVMALVVALTALAYILEAEHADRGFPVLVVSGLICGWVISRAHEKCEALLSNLEGEYQTSKKYTTKLTEEEMAKNAEAEAKMAETARSQQQAEPTTSEENNHQIEKEAKSDQQSDEKEQKNTEPAVRSHSSEPLPSSTFHASYRGWDNGAHEPTEDEFIAGEIVSAEDVSLLKEAGYDALDLELMDSEKRTEALELAGVDPDQYDFWD